MSSVLPDVYLRLSTCLYSYMDIVEVTCRPTFQSDPYLCFPLYNIIWGFVWRLIMSYEPLCLCGKSRITRNISKKQMEMALMMMMLMKKEKISWSIRFLSLTITQCTSSRVRPSSSHQKTEERGKQQMTRKIDKTWGCRIAKSTHWQDLSDFFSKLEKSNLLSLLVFWRIRYEWCDKFMARLNEILLICNVPKAAADTLLQSKKTKLMLAFNHGPFWHQIPRAFLSESITTTAASFFPTFVEKSPFPHSLIDG